MEGHGTLSPEDAGLREISGAKSFDRNLKSCYGQQSFSVGASSSLRPVRSGMIASWSLLLQMAKFHASDAAGWQPV